MQDFFKEKSESLIPELVSGVRILFTEREGGVSSGPWGGAEGIMGLNVATHVGDNAACVRMNRSIEEAHEHLLGCKTLVITLGTAVVYRRRDTGEGR